MPPKTLIVKDAPPPNGNYSHVYRAGGIVHLCGFMGDALPDGGIVPGGIVPQTEQTMQNIKVCLEAAGTSLDKVIRRRLFVTDIRDLMTVQDITRKYLSEPWPVSTAIQVAGLAKPGAVVEIEMDAEE